MTRPARFTIRAASALTGINPNTLRAWERRYGLVQPERTPKGYRLYTEDDLRRLQLIHRALQQGITVGRVREHLDAVEVEDGRIRGSEAGGDSTKETRAVARGAGWTATARPALPGQAPSTSRSLELVSEQIEEAVMRFDHAKLDQAFGRAVGLYTLRHAFNHALAPALARIGERYLRDPANIAEEHFLTAFARERLHAALAGLKPLHQHPRLVCACVPGERHEIGLMLLALEAGLEGVSTLYLGADTPVEALLRAAHDSGVRAVALSATVVLPLETLGEVHEKLAALPRQPALLVGGPAAEPHRDWLADRGIKVLPLDSIDAGRVVVESVLQV